MKRFPLLLTLVFPAPAGAFFDDFDGDRLQSHWRLHRFHLSEVEYHLSNSMLHVTRLYGQLGWDGGGVSFSAPLNSAYSHTYDFEATAAIGWDEGEWHGVGLGVAEEFSHGLPVYIAAIGYARRPGENPMVAAAFLGGQGYREIPAPPSGFHEFRLRRQGDLMEAYFDGTLVSSARRDPENYLANLVYLGFSGPDSPQFAPLHVDWVQAAVPEPATLSSFAVGGLWLFGKRRRRCVSR